MIPEADHRSEQQDESGRIALIATACLLGGFMAFLVYSRNFIFGSDAGNWSYEYLRQPNAVPVWIPAAVVVLLGLTVLVGSRFLQARPTLVLLLSFVASLLIQILLQRVSGITLGSIIADQEANGFYSAAQRHTLIDVLSRFETLAPTFPLHAQTNMPGKVVLFDLLGAVSRSPDVQGYLVLTLSAAGAWLMYGICLRLFADRFAGYFAFLLYALVPCKLFFQPLPNTVTPVLMLLSLYLFVSSMQLRQRRWMWLLGASLYALVFFEPSPLVTGVLFGGLLAAVLHNGSLSRNYLARMALHTLLGFLGLYVLARLLFSFDLLHTFGFVLGDAVDFNARAARGYRLWLLENAKEFLYSAGTPVVLLFVYDSLRVVASWRGKSTDPARWSMESVFTLSLLATFAVVLLLGINRGEVSRLWIYLAVLFQIPAAFHIARAPMRAPLLLAVCLALAAQSIVALQLVGFV